MRTKLLITSLTATLLLFNSAANATPVLRTNATGDIVGFDMININGEFWNATFNNEFSNTVYGEQFALDASEALLTEFTGSRAFSDSEIDTLFLDSVVGFESGFIDSNVFATVWASLTTSSSIKFHGFWNRLGGDDFRDNVWSPTFFIVPQDYPHITYLDWEKQVSAVPIPASAFMFAPAVLGFLGLRRRAKQA